MQREAALLAKRCDLGLHMAPALMLLAATELETLMLICVHQHRVQAKNVYGAGHQGFSRHPTSK